MKNQPSLTYQGVYPIGDTDPNNLPVHDLDAVLAYYVDLGFTVETRTAQPHPSARLRRDQVIIGLAQNGGDPEQASCYMEVSDVEAAHAELLNRDLGPTEIRTDQHDGATYRVFFVRDPDGLCYCLGQQQ
jgi:catechol 2,3-dioxygenase-like lactoylglutathione lyase family enzyme